MLFNKVEKTLDNSSNIVKSLSQYSTTNQKINAHKHKKLTIKKYVFILLTTF